MAYVKLTAAFYLGESTETKPNNDQVPIGAKFLETDTGDTYILNSARVWVRETHVPDVWDVDTLAPTKMTKPMINLGDVTVDVASIADRMPTTLTSAGNFKVSVSESVPITIGNSNQTVTVSNSLSIGNGTVTIVGVADSTTTGTINAYNGTVQLAFNGHGSCGVVLSGTWVGTVVIEGSADGGSTWTSCWFSSINQSPVAYGIPTPINSVTTNGTYKVFNTGGITHYRVRCSAYTSGTINVSIAVVGASPSFIYTAGSIIQQVAADDNNSSTSNLGGSATYTGTAVSTLGVAGIQVSLKTDQNCYVYVEQSPDGENWDISDVYNYFASINNFGVTVQAINSYTRVRVKNLSTSSTTYFRLQTALCPIVEVVPRSLSEDGNLKTEIFGIYDDYGFGVENTPNDEMRVISPYRLVGATFTGNVLDTNFWTSSLGTGGTITVANAQVVLGTGSTADNVTSIQSVRTARYVGGSAHRFRHVMRLPDSGTANNTRRWGAFTSTDGAFFELSGTTLKVVTRKGGADTAVSSGSFNGVLGSTYSVDTSVHTYEIYWNNSKVYFVIGGRLLHTVTASSTTWTNTVHLPTRFENNNSGGSSSEVYMNVRNSVIHRLGSAQTQPNSKWQSGTTTGVLLKSGPGNLHGIAVSGVINNAVITLYDGTSSGGSTMWASGTMGANTVPFSVDMFNAPFYTGLFLVISGANANIMVIYE